MCWVMPPASPAMTLVLRMWSSSEVLPWSTWPMTVTIGARGSRSLSSSSSTLTASCTSALTYSVLRPNSSATRLMVSASRRWLMEAITPMLISVEITWVTPTFIIVASSDTVTNSVSFSILLSLRSALASAESFSCTASRFSLRYLAPFLVWLCLLVRRASVSFTWRATSSSFTSSGFWLRLRLLLFLPAAAFPALLPPPLRGLGCWLTAALMSTRSLLMRWRFRRSPLLVPCLALSSRSLRFSSLLFFLGRVLWFRASRSILPSTFTLGALRIFFSLLSWNTLGSSLVSASATAGCAASSWGSGSVVAADCAVEAGSAWVSAGAGAAAGGACGSASTALGASSTGSAGTGLTAAAFVSGAFSGWGATVSGAAGFCPRWSRSILPRGLYCWRTFDSSRLSARWSSFLVSTRFFSLGFLKSFSASLRTAASCLKASTSAAYCWSLSLKLRSAFTSPSSFFFSRNSTAV